MKVLVVPGSARPNSVGKVVSTFVERELAAHENVEVTVASLDDISLPFLDTPMVPAFEGYEIEHDSVADWTRLVSDADAFVFLIPEYNSGISGIQKNAIDWVYQGWNGKRAAAVTYNFYDKKSALEAIRPVFTTVQIELVEPVAGLKFGEEIDPDGSVLDAEGIETKVAAAIEALLAQSVVAAE